MKTTHNSTASKRTTFANPFPVRTQRERPTRPSANWRFARWRANSWQPTGWALLMLLLGAVCTSTARAQGALTNGLAHDGAISAAAQTNTWTIVANQGDRITVQVAKLTGGAGFTPMLEFFAPDGTQLGVQSGALAARLDIQAAVTGTYTVVVSDASRTGTGTYRLRLAQVPGAFTVPAGDEGGSLTNGMNQPGVIDPGDLDLWNITASQGDWITVQIGEVSGGAGFTPMIELFAPDGTRLGVNAGAATARIDVQAVVGGTYTLLVSDSTQSGAGSYELHLAQVPESFVVSAGDEGGTLALGVDQDGNIPVGDIDLWTFTAVPGNRAVLQITELTGGAGFTPQIELFAPNGARKGIASGASAATLDTATEADGTYTLLVSDATQSGAGTYRLHLTQTSIVLPGANALTNGATHLGSISAAGASNTWTFLASVGESIVLWVGEITQTGTFTPRIRLLNPSGVQQATSSGALAADLTTTATNGGIFTVVVDSTTAGTGTYRLSLAKTGSPLMISANDEGGALTNGATHTGSIDVGDIDAWTFTANARESIVVWIGETSASSLIPWLRVFGPNGVLLSEDFNAAAAEVTVRATNSGTFLVVVGDGNVGRSGTGSYRLSMAKTGSALTISPSDEGGALTNGATYAGSIEVGDIDAWTFTANAGESIVVWTGEITAGSTLLPWLRVFGPNGALLVEDFNASAAEVTVRATNSGTFLVVVGDGNNGRGGTGNYRLSMAKTGSALTISAGDEGGALTNGTTHLGSIETGDMDPWTFTANAGESIIVRVGETAAASALLPWVRVSGPNGVMLGENFSAAAAEVAVRATNSGTFLVVVGDGNNGRAGTGNYRLTLAKTGTPLVISPNDEGGSLMGAGTYQGTIDVGDLDVWTFTACISNVIVVRMEELVANSTLIPWIRLYGRDGTLLSSNFNASTAQISVRAPFSGSYTLVVGDGTVGFAGSGTYRLTVNGLSDGLKLCVPIISGTDLLTSGVGGITNSTYALFTSTNTPGPSWTPIRTNQFDQYGVFISTNRYDANVTRQYFLLQQR